MTRHTLNLIAVEYDRTESRLNRIRACLEYLIEESKGTIAQVNYLKSQALKLTQKLNKLKQR